MSYSMINTVMVILAGSEMEDEDVDVGDYEQPKSHISSARTEKGMALGKSSGVLSSS